MSQTRQPVLGNYNKIGPVYIVNNTSKEQAVISITEWEEPAEKNTWHYYIQLNDVKNNALLNKKEIAVTHKKWDHEQVIGRLGNNIWIITDSLVAYNQHSLELSATETTITEVNPFMKNDFSRYHNSYLLDEAVDVMYFRTGNGDKYKLYPTSLSLKPDDGINETAAEDYSYESYANYKLYDRYDMKYALTCVDSLHNTLYILGSEKETSFVLSYFGTAIFPDRNENRQITIVPYHADGEKLDYAKHPPLTSKNKYYTSGFLQKKFTTTAWKNNDKERIILYQSNNKNLPTICIALINKNGTEKWKADSNMPVTNFTDYLVSDHSLLLWFKVFQKENNTLQTVIVNIDLENGKAGSYDLQ